MTCLTISYETSYSQIHNFGSRNSITAVNHYCTCFNIKLLKVQFGVLLIAVIMSLIDADGVCVVALVHF